MCYRTKLQRGGLALIDSVCVCIYIYIHIYLYIQIQAYIILYLYNFFYLDSVDDSIKSHNSPRTGAN